MGTQVNIGCYYEVVKPFGKYFNKKGERFYAWFGGQLIMIRDDNSGFPYNPSKMIQYIDKGYLKCILPKKVKARAYEGFMPSGENWEAEI